MNILCCFCQYLKAKAGKESPTSLKSKITFSLSASDYRRANRVIFSAIQKEKFPSEFDSIEREKKVTKQSKIVSLSPYLDEENKNLPLFRVSGRIHHREDGKKSSNHPIILPRDHLIVPLLIQHHHQIHGHVGIQHMRANLQQSVWIIQDGAAVRSFL